MDGITYASSAANDGVAASVWKGRFVEAGEKRVLREQKGFGEGVLDMDREQWINHIPDCPLPLQAS